MALRDKGITELPLAWHDARLVPHGYIMHAVKSRHRKRLLVCRTRTDG
jgi:hypothetical protein